VAKWNFESTLIRLDFSVPGQFPFGRVAPSAFADSEGPLLEVRMACNVHSSRYDAEHDDCIWELFLNTPLDIVQVQGRARASAMQWYHFSGRTRRPLYLDTVLSNDR